ncbi:hypothetical protein [Actinomycetospora sp. CA-084318]|uniref:hypothetical protein n=1 Tax=Actinomycetospora sp. CA-084318 TaxID=3239892 RepID=UPI003D9766F6
MLESGLRFAFAFLPAGVAVVVGLVLAIQRRRVQPDVATPAMWGLGLQLVAIVAGALVNVIPSSIVQGGGNPSTAVTVATVIALLVAALTVVSWVLILTALFRRLPAVANADAPTTAVPTPPPGFTPEPFADDAPTGRHALLDEHGQQVVAQAGVRLSPQTAGLAAGAGVVGAAGLGAAAAASDPDPSAPGPTADLPTEAVPIVGHRPGPSSDDSNASPLASGDRESGSVEAPDPGPAGVDEAAVGGTPTGAEPDDPAAPSSPAQVARPTPSPVATPDPGPVGVDEAAVGGTPTGVDPSADENDTDLTPVPDAEQVAEGVDAAAEVEVDEAAVGGTPTTADADPASPSTDGQSPTPSSSPFPAAPARPSPRPQPSAPFPAASGPTADRPAASPSGPQPAGSAPSGPQPAAPAPSGPQPAVAPPSGPQPAAPAASFPSPARPAPRPQPSPGAATPDRSETPTAGGSRQDPAATEHDDSAEPPSGTPASHPGLAGTMRSPRPAPSASGSDLFTPSAPIPEVADEAVGGTPAEPPARQSRSSRAPVAGWFEPVTDGAADGFGAENRDN